MMFAGYRKRLESDLARWVGEGLVSAASAATIRRRLQEEGGGVKLPSVLAMLGGLLLASSVIAFVAANWQAIPRLGKLVAVLALIVVSLGLAGRHLARGSTRAAEVAATAGTLIFGAGVALVGQMYHLPADWPAGALMVGIGAATVAAFLRSDGALIVAFICAVSWLYGVQDSAAPNAPPHYLALYLPLLALAIGRGNRVVHHAAVLAAAAWLVLFFGNSLFSDKTIGASIAYGLFLSVAFVALGMLAHEARLPALFTACLPWGLAGFAVALALQLMRVLEAGGAAGIATPHVVAAGVAGLAATGAMAALTSDRKAAVALAVSLLAAMATSIAFWIGLGQAPIGRIGIAALVLASSCALVVAGSLTGLRRITLAGTAAFGLAVIALLYRTIGTLLDQSLFFLVGGVALIAIGSGVRKLIRRVQPGGPEVAP